MKFGGTSVASAERIAAAAEIVRARRKERPLVVVSALAGVTDLLVAAFDAALEGDHDAVEPHVADLERRHRWALGGTIDEPERRHGLQLEVDALFEELRGRLRSIRILGEATTRARDSVLAMGETLSAKLVVAAFVERELPAEELEPREVLVTDGRHGAARPLPERVRERAAERIAPLLAEGRVPVMGGFVGATATGETTTLGRGGSDTSAAVLGAALGAAEIQIWTDVDGMMTADPRRVPGARRLEEVSFAEAAELARHGAKVLHPASIVPAVGEGIPVRVLNSLKPDGPGTVIVDGRDAPPGVTAIASRSEITLLRISAPGIGPGSDLLPATLAAVAAQGAAPESLQASAAAVTLTVSGPVDTQQLREALGAEVQVRQEIDRGMICIVGRGLSRSAEVRGAILRALAEAGAELATVGASETAVLAVVPGERLDAVVVDLHRRFFEEGAEA